MKLWRYQPKKKGGLELSKQTVRDFLLSFIQRNHILPKEVDSVDLLAEGYIDSMAIIRLVIELESVFDVRIDEEDIASGAFKTIEGIVTLVEQRQR